MNKRDTGFLTLNDAPRAAILAVLGYQEGGSYHETELPGMAHGMHSTLVGQGPTEPGAIGREIKRLIRDGMLKKSGDGMVTMTETGKAAFDALERDYSKTFNRAGFFHPSRRSSVSDPPQAETTMEL